MKFKINNFSRCLLLYSLILVGCSEEQKAEPVEKQFAADFTLKLLNGQEFRLSDHKGKPIFINFWASWCFPCAEEAAAIEKAYQEYSKKGVVFVGIAVDDTEEAARKFIKKYKLTFALGLDTGKIRESYTIYGIPTTLFVNKQGRVTYLHMGGVTENLIKHELDKILQGDPKDAL